MEFKGRERSVLERARRTGCLDQRNQHRDAVRREYERWCRTMKIPIVRILRQSPRSRFSIVVLEMYTTPNTLSAEGQEAVVHACEKACRRPERSLSAFGGEFHGSLNPAALKFAREIFRLATHLGYYLPDLALLEARRRKSVRNFTFRHAATA